MQNGVVRWLAMWLQAIARAVTGQDRAVARRDESPLVSTLFEDEPGLVGIVEKFVIRFPDMLDEMAVSVAHADWVALAGQAHNLKGVGGGFGYPQVSQLAEQLESAALGSDAAGAGRILDELRHLSKRITLGLRQSAP